MEEKTFKFIYSEWKKVKCATVKESTFATYVTNADKHIVPFFGAETVVSESMVQEFVSQKTGSGLSNNTLRGLLQVLRMLATFGMRHGWTVYNGWDVRLPENAEHHELRVLSLSDQRRLMCFLRENISFRNIGLYICLCTGMRIGEICALRWGDIRLDIKAIRVCRTIERIYQEHGDVRRTRVIISPPKTRNSARDIPVSTDLTRILKPFISIAPVENYVLTNSCKPLEPRLYRRHYMQLMKNMGLPKLNFHGLRHTFATRCIESRCDYKTVSSILGHSSISTTMNLYVHPDIEQKRRCIDKMLRSMK